MLIGTYILMERDRKYKERVSHMLPSFAIVPTGQQKDGKIFLTTFFTLELVKIHFKYSFFLFT